MQFICHSLTGSARPVSTEVTDSQILATETAQISPSTGYIMNCRRRYVPRICFRISSRATWCLPCVRRWKFSRNKSRNSLRGTHNSSTRTESSDRRRHLKRWRCLRRHCSSNLRRHRRSNVTARHHHRIICTAFQRSLLLLVYRWRSTAATEVTEPKFPKQET